MHLLATTSGVIDGAAEAVDLAQSPADLIVISAADSELAALASASDQLGSEAPSVRLANLMALGHNLSVDTYVDQTARHAKLVVVRLLGGRSYWSYGVEQLQQLQLETDCMVVFLPGGTEPDAELQSLSNVAPADCERLRQYLAEGGQPNATAFLQFAAALLKPNPSQITPPPRPLARAGLYWPNMSDPALADMQAKWMPDAPVAAITFYRALIEGGFTAPVEFLIEALRERGLNALPAFISGLKDATSASFLGSVFATVRPDIVLNCTGFAVGGSQGESTGNPLEGPGCPILQVIFSGTSRNGWQDSDQGLPTRDLAMNVVLPELDGRILARPVSFKADGQYHERTQCRIVTYEPVPDRIDFTADLAANWVRLARMPANERRVCIVLANYPNQDGRIGNGVGYDTPASTMAILDHLAANGFAIDDLPADGNTLIKLLQSGPTNQTGALGRRDAVAMDAGVYANFFAALPHVLQQEVTERWGPPHDDPFFGHGGFELPVRLFGNVAVAIQPARGYNIDPKETYHDPSLVPPHGYLAFYAWVRHVFGAHAVIHNGKHGNLEWLPGKAVGLSGKCYPEAALGPLPHLYPFIVNDPGEGTQAKRRASAVIIDHLTPPLTRAETYGPLRDLEVLVDEYYLASGLDARRLASLKAQILSLTQSSGLDQDCGIAGIADEDAALQMLDTYLCDLKEAQIRDGLHILGESPKGELETNLLVALTRLDRGTGEGGNKSLIKALAIDLGMGNWQPFLCDPGGEWTGGRPIDLQSVSADPWRTNGDTTERLELLAARLVAGQCSCRQDWKGTRLVLDHIDGHVRPSVQACGPQELAAVSRGLDGGFVSPGPSGAPTRGRLDVLPTGRNFFSVDNRAVPTPTAWDIGRRSAEAMLTRHFQDNGSYPAAIGLSVWGTSNMRTGGDDIAQALALIGVAPRWDAMSGRMTGFDIQPLAALGRPRVDVTLRISGFFRDAFPAQIELFDKASRAVGALDEPEADNPIAARMRREAAELTANGASAADAERLAGFRIFGSKPGAYGAGLQALIDEKLWSERADLARAYVTWGAYAYGAKVSGENDPDSFQRRLARIEAVVQNQDNREHDLLDSDDYYQFEGGMSAAVEQASGQQPIVYHNDHSRPERPVARTLEEEIGRVVRSRVVNPKWISGVKRHGYRGAFEIAATVDYLFAFAATTGAAKSHHFELAYDAYLQDDATRDFIADNNPAALGEIAERFNEAIARGLWTPKSNSAYDLIKSLTEELHA